MAVLRRTQIELHRARFAAMIPLATPRLFARLYDAPFYRAMHERWLDTLPLAGTRTAVDIGCGPGGLSSAVATRGLEVTGVDRSESMLEKAREREREGVVRFVLGDATALPCEDRSFDVVVCSSLLNIVDDPAQVLREMRRVLRPGGLVSVLMPAPSLTTAAARAFGESAELPADDAALLLLWASAPPKVSLTQASAWFAAQGMTGARQDSLLDGLVHVTTWSASQ
jgi:ubiquinone/menaquinone biosynthesis C-methylase UbiE